MNEPTFIKQGETVRLIGSERVMLVKSVGSYPLDLVCEWSEGGKIRSEHFHREVLEVWKSQ